MAQITFPIVIDGFECVEDMVKAVLEWSYKGITLKDWGDKISSPRTNADRIRSMSDEELAEFLSGFSGMCETHCPFGKCGALESDLTCGETALKWLKQEAQK